MDDHTTQRPAYVARLRQHGFEPRFLADGTPCSMTAQGDSPHRVFVASMPKAGTYLVAEMLSALGLQDSKLHVDEGWASDFRATQAGTPMWKYQFEMPTDDALALVQPGQFAVGHLPPSGEGQQSLASFRLVFAYRELRHVLASWGRFVFAENMDGGVAEAATRLADGPARVSWVLERPSSAWLWPNLQAMAAWRREPGVFAVRFEALAGDEGEQAQRDALSGLASHLDIAIDPDQAASILRAGVGRPTLTYSGARSQLERHWDAGLEAWFRAQGGLELNRALGYEEP